MKLAIFVSALSVLTISSSALALSAPPSQKIDRPIGGEIYARSIDITTGVVESGQPTFLSRDGWYATISKSGNSYIYSGGQKGKPGIRLTGGKLLYKRAGKHIYSWRNGDTASYTVTWNPSDPNFARIQAFTGYSGKEVFNKLMQADVD